MAGSNPLVSIIITCYNYADYVAEAIDSALNQSYANREIIVINDGSTDASQPVIDGYGKRIRAVNRKNKGIVYTRNEGLDKAKGKYVLFLDADNRLTKNYVERLVSFAEDNRADVVYTDMQMFGELSSRSDFPDYSVELLKIYNYIDINSLVRRDIAIGQRFDEHLEKLTHEDWDFFLGLALKGAKIVKLQGVVFDYRIHKRGVSRNVDNRFDAQRYSDMVRYVFDKYARTYNDFVPSHTRFVRERLTQLKAAQLENKRLKRRVDDQDVIVASLNRRVLEMQNSYTWKIGTLFTGPLGRIKSIIRKR